MSQWTESFSDAVNSAVRAHLSVFGFAVASEQPGYMVVQSECCVITFILERITVAIMVGPARIDAATESAPMYINVILDTLAPGKGFLSLMNWLHGPDELHGEVARQVSLLVEYCGGILRGDFSDWPRIVESNLHPKLEQPAQSRNDRVSRLRDQASQAFVRKHYLVALQNYYVLQKEFSEELTTEERDRIRQAKAWLNGFGPGRGEQGVCPQKG